MANPPVTLPRSADVTVVGGGLAGLACAVRTRQLGLSVNVLEQGEGPHYACNTRFTSGLFHISGDNLMDHPERLRANILRATAGEADDALVQALVTNVARTMQWLKTLGVKFIKVGPDGLRSNALSPPGARKTGLHWQGRAGDTLLRDLGARLSARGGQMHDGATATTLIMDDDRCIGVRARIRDEEIHFHSRAVVLADGGFPASAELIARHICARPDRLLQRNAGTARGNGIRMAKAVGAHLVGMERFYGHLQHRDAMHDSGLWPYPALDTLATAGIVVNAQGRRFCDEGGGGVFVANAIAHLPDPLEAWVIFDHAIWEGPGRNWLLPPNPNLLTAGASMVCAPTVALLATGIGLDPDALAASIGREDSSSAGTSPPMPGAMPNETRPVPSPDSRKDMLSDPLKRPSTLFVPRTQDRIKAWPITTPPFYAIPLCAGITSTTGGIATDGHTHVLRPDGRIIPGLYAAGGCTGGLEGGGYAGYVGGLAKSSTFGMLAAESLSLDIRGHIRGQAYTL